VHKLVQIKLSGCDFTCQSKWWWWNPLQVVYTAC